jgi:hypothetical protein
MADENKTPETTPGITLDQIKALFGSFKTEIMTEVNQTTNKALSSYKQDTKKLLSKKNVDTAELEDDVVEDDGVSRKPTKRELALQSNVEKLLERLDTADKNTRLANNKAKFVEVATKAGILPEAIDMVYQLNSPKFVDIEGVGTMWKVEVGDGLAQDLPVEKAINYYVKTPEAKFFLNPKGNKGTGTKPTGTTQTQTFDVTDRPSPTKGTSILKVSQEAQSKILEKEQALGINWGSLSPGKH